MAPVPGPKAEQGARAAMADQETREAMADQETREAMADLPPRLRPQPAPASMTGALQPPPKKKKILGELTGLNFGTGALSGLN